MIEVQQLQEARSQVGPAGLSQPAMVGRAEHYPAVAVLAAHNEDRLIGSAVLKLKAVADWVVVVDLGSADRTAAVARAAGAEVIAPPAGSSRLGALQVGLDRAWQLGSETAVLIGNCASNLTEWVPTLLAPIASGQADMVVGTPPGKELPDGAGRGAAYAMYAVRRGPEPVQLADEEAGATCRIHRIELPAGPIAPSRAVAARLRRPLRIPTVGPLLAMGAAGGGLTLWGLSVGYQCLMLYHDTGQLALGRALSCVLLLTLGVAVGLEGLTLEVIKRTLRAVRDLPSARK